MNLDNLYQMCENVENVRLIVTPTHCGTMKSDSKIKYYLQCPFCQRGMITTENHEKFTHLPDCTVEKAKIAAEQIKEFVINLADDPLLHEHVFHETPIISIPPQPPDPPAKRIIREDDPRELFFVEQISKAAADISRAFKNFFK